MQTLSLEGATRNAREYAGIIARWRTKFHPLAERNSRAALILFAEVLIGVGAYLFSAALFSQQDSISLGLGWYWSAVIVSVVAAVLASVSGGLYRRSLRHASVLDVRPLVRAVVLNAGILVSVLWLSNSDKGSRASLIFLDSLLLLVCWGGLHFGARTWCAGRASQRKSGARAVIVGAGDAGLTLLRQTALDPNSPFRPVGLVDDDHRKWGRTLFGVSVLGPVRDLASVASLAHAEAILVCIPSASHAQMHHILDTCRRLNLPVRSLPSLSELINSDAAGNLLPRRLSTPRIEYLLQRDGFQVDSQRTRELIQGKTVLVTGAGGSIGSELARQITDARPAQLLLLDKSENSLFYANLDVAERLGFERVKPILADLSSMNRTRSVLKNERPDLVFHAAAHKHVSMIELHPAEAIRNNVLGTRNLVEAALEFGVASLVNISTDKAVGPRSFMGLSKKLTELCIQEYAEQASAGRLATRLSNVRFGNVAGSTGSVVRLFWEQIQKGGPIRVTDPQASRYFMSATEAVHLILGAAGLGRKGETFIFEMGEPFNIYELAKTMTLFSGLRPHRDIAIEFTGLRKGEKLTEQLCEDWEHPVATSSNGILIIRQSDPRSRGILAAIREMEQALASEDPSRLMSSIGEIFPNFGPNAGSERRTAVASFTPTPVLKAVNPVEAT